MLLLRLWNLSGFAVMMTLAGFAAAAIFVLLAFNRVPLGYNFRNLTVRWKTTLLTALAFTLVIALLTVMQAFVNGMRKLTENSGRPDNLLVLSDGAPDEAISNLAVGDLSELEHLPQVLRRGARPFASRETFIVANQAVEVAGAAQPLRRFLQIRGVEDVATAAEVHDLRLLPGGSWFSPAGVRELPESEEGAAAAPAIECVVGEGMARELGRHRTRAQRAQARNRNRLDVGDTFPLGNRTWLIVGILDSAESTFNSEVWAKRSLVGPILGKDSYTTLVLRTGSAEQAAELKEYLTPTKPDQSDQAAKAVESGYRKAAVAAQVETVYYQSLSETSRQFSWAIGFIAVVMSIGGVFGVMNTMFAAISQRIKDIGVMRLIGFSSGQILLSFVIESLGIAVIGGLLGCLLGSLCDGWSVTSVISSGMGAGKTVAFKLAIDAPILARGMLLTLLMGLIGGLLPALNAMRLRALEALR